MGNNCQQWSDRVAQRPIAGPSPLFVVMLFALCLYHSGAHAVPVVVEQPLASGIVASAEYRSGASERPAILVLHGFLQTRNFATVAGLVESLSDSGYATLAPTLSLGIDRRKRSLPCEAVHSHTMEADVAEIAHWVDWLGAQGYGEVVLVGHSFGSLQSLVYLHQNRDTAVRYVIAVSLVDAEREAGATDRRRQQQAAAEAMLASAPDQLGHFQISFCKDYVSPPGPFLSYLHWGRERITGTLGMIGARVSIIVGGQDRRMAADWANELRQTGARVVIVEGANHFFDGVHQFDLDTEVLSTIETRRGEASQ